MNSLTILNIATNAAKPYLTNPDLALGSEGPHKIAEAYMNKKTNVLDYMYVSLGSPIAISNNAPYKDLLSDWTSVGQAGQAVYASVGTYIQSELKRLTVSLSDYVNNYYSYY